MLNRKIKALVDGPDGGNVSKGEIGTVVAVLSKGTRYLINFPSQASYIIDYPIDKKKYQLISIIFYKKKNKSNT